MARQGYPSFSQMDAAHAANHQLHVQPLLQLGDRLGQGRLGHAQGDRRRGDRAVLGDDQEIVQLPEIEHWR